MTRWSWHSSYPAQGDWLHLGLGMSRSQGHGELLTQMTQSSKSPAPVGWTPNTPQLTPVTSWTFTTTSWERETWPGSG